MCSYILLKRVVVMIMSISILPFILITRLSFLFKLQEIYYFCSCLMSLFPGMVGSYMRVGYYKATVKKMSYDTSIGFCSFFSKPGVVSGRFVTIGAFTVVSDVIIEDEVLIGSRCSIMWNKYLHEDYADDRNQKNEVITIGRHSWIGDNCVIMANVGSNCIVSSGSVVTRDMPDNTIAVGNPARPLPRKKVKKDGNE